MTNLNYSILILILVSVSFLLGSINRSNEEGLKYLLDCGEWDDSCTSDSCHYLFQQYRNYYTVHAYCVNGDQHAYGEVGCMGPSWFDLCCIPGDECEGDEGDEGDGGDDECGDDDECD